MRVGSAGTIKVRVFVVGVRTSMIVIKANIKKLFDTLDLPESRGVVVVAGSSLRDDSSFLTRKKVYVLRSGSSCSDCFRSAVGTKRCRGEGRSISLVVHDSERVVRSLVNCNMSFRGRRASRSKGRTTSGNNRGTRVRSVCTFAHRKTRSHPEVLFRTSVAKGRVADGLLTRMGRLSGMALLRCAAVASVVMRGSRYGKVLTRSGSKGRFGVRTRGAV